MSIIWNKYVAEGGGLAPPSSLPEFSFLEGDKGQYIRNDGSEFVSAYGDIGKWVLGDQDTDPFNTLDALIAALKAEAPSSAVVLIKSPEVWGHLGHLLLDESFLNLGMTVEFIGVGEPRLSVFIDGETGGNPSRITFKGFTFEETDTNLAFKVKNHTHFLSLTLDSCTSDGIKIEGLAEEPPGEEGFPASVLLSVTKSYIKFPLEEAGPSLAVNGNFHRLDVTVLDSKIVSGWANVNTIHIASSECTFEIQESRVLKTPGAAGYLYIDNGDAGPVNSSIVKNCIFDRDDQSQDPVVLGTGLTVYPIWLHDNNGDGVSVSLCTVSDSLIYVPQYADGQPGFAVFTGASGMASGPSPKCIASNISFIKGVRTEKIIKGSADTAFNELFQTVFQWNLATDIHNLPVDKESLQNGNEIVVAPTGIKARSPWPTIYRLGTDSWSDLDSIKDEAPGVRHVRFEPCVSLGATTIKTSDWLGDDPLDDQRIVFEGPAVTRSNYLNVSLLHAGFEEVNGPVLTLDIDDTVAKTRVIEFRNLFFKGERAVSGRAGIVHVRGAGLITTEEKIIVRFINCEFVVDNPDLAGTVQTNSTCLHFADGNSFLHIEIEDCLFSNTSAEGVSSIALISMTSVSSMLSKLSVRKSSLLQSGNEAAGNGAITIAAIPSEVNIEDCNFIVSRSAIQASNLKKFYVSGCRVETPGTFFFIPGPSLGQIEDADIFLENNYVKCYIFFNIMATGGVSTFSTITVSGNISKGVSGSSAWGDPDCYLPAIDLGYWRCYAGYNSFKDAAINNVGGTNNELISLEWNLLHST